MGYLIAACEAGYDPPVGPHRRLVRRHRMDAALVGAHRARHALRCAGVEGGGVGTARSAVVGSPLRRRRSVGRSRLRSCGAARGRASKSSDPRAITHPPHGAAEPARGTTTRSSGYTVRMRASHPYPGLRPMPATRRCGTGGLVGDPDRQLAVTAGASARIARGSRGSGATRWLSRVSQSMFAARDRGGHIPLVGRCEAFGTHAAGAHRRQSRVDVLTGGRSSTPMSSVASSAVYRSGRADPAPCGRVIRAGEVARMIALTMGRPCRLCRPSVRVLRRGVAPRRCRVPPSRGQVGPHEASTGEVHVSHEMASTGQQPWIFLAGMAHPLVGSTHGRVSGLGCVELQPGAMCW